MTILETIENLRTQFKEQYKRLDDMVYELKCQEEKKQREQQQQLIKNIQYTYTLETIQLSDKVFYIVLCTPTPESIEGIISEDYKKPIYSCAFKIVNHVFITNNTNGKNIMYISNISNGDIVDAMFMLKLTEKEVPEQLYRKLY